MTTRPIEHRKVLDRPFADVCTVVDAHTEEILQRATAAASRHVVELVHDAVEPMPGFDSSEPVTIFLIDPDRDSEYQAWIDFRWTADPHKRLLANTRARLEVRPHPSRHDATELVLSARYEPTPESRHHPRVLARGRRIITAALERFLDEAATYLDNATATFPDSPSAPAAAPDDTPARGQAAPDRDPASPDPTPDNRHTRRDSWETTGWFHKILFVSPTAQNEPPATLETAVAFADHNNADLTILGIVADPPPRQRRLRIPGRAERLSDLLATELTARLDDWSEPFAGNNIAVQVGVGKPPVEITRHVLARNHDLLIVADDRTPTSSAVIRRLLRLCPTPVWVMRPGHDGGQVLAAIDPDDDPDLNQRILQLAYAQTRRRDGELHITHAWELHGETILATSDYMPVPGTLLAQLAEHTEAEHRHAFHTTVDQAGVGPHHKHLVNATPIQAIVGLANLHRIDLLVMGSVGRAGLDDILVGNTADNVLTHVDCSILVVKPPGFRSCLERDRH